MTSATDGEQAEDGESNQITAKDRSVASRLKRRMQRHRKVELLRQKVRKEKKGIKELQDKFKRNYGRGKTRERQ